MKHMGTVLLETQRLILRKFKQDDAQEMFDNWASDEEVAKYLTWQPHADTEVTKQILRRWTENYKNNSCYNWAIKLKSTGELIGSISVVQTDEAVMSAELGYCMGKKWWGKEYMPEAGKAVIKYLFEEVGFNRIAARHDSENAKSGRVMQKLGMTREGILRSAGVNNRGIIDDVWYSILKKEYDAAK